MKSPVVFTDWDGTVTLQDSNDYMTDHLGFGEVERKRIGKMILDEKLSFRDGFNMMLKSITDKGYSMEYCIETLLKNIKLDPGFRPFLEWCKAHNVPLYVISSGMRPIINALLKTLVGDDAADYVNILANDVEYDSVDHSKWHIVYRDETPFGHDKSRSIKKILAEYHDVKPIAFYCGDGVSDLSASSTCDLLFARSGKDLVTFCDRHHIPYREFYSFVNITDDVNAVSHGVKTIEDCLVK
ncbi:hypothetical protein FOA43_000517 [Brettanomyces nanus]|uniref:Phosphatase n=1 Tax=Eeniella nana TaxID=13502 RepID=A0A875RN61_EENNA|nr:uncharacterized protein FOA43_000517 [Brettanomyces nanus]QPG73210.1 hypothetical protein FOA43_000517 [Brettanomyces nanus]